MNATFYWESFKFRRVYLFDHGINLYNALDFNYYWSNFTVSWNSANLTIIYLAHCIFKMLILNSLVRLISNAWYGEDNVWQRMTSMRRYDKYLFFLKNIQLNSMINNICSFRFIMQIIVFIVFTYVQKYKMIDGK